MGARDIFLEHRRGEKVQKVLRVKSGRDMFVIGSSREADLRIHGQDVQGVHAILRNREGQWFVCDVSGTESVKVNGQTVTEALVDETAKVEIAGHALRLFAKERRTDLFKQSDSGDDKETEAHMGALVHHQIVVRSRGRVIATHIMKAGESFTWNDGDRKLKLASPSDGEWTSTELDSRRVVQQRLVSEQELAQAEKITIDRDLRKPFALALLLLISLVGSALLFGTKHDAPAEVALDKKSMDIIFNAKAIQKKKAEAKKIEKVAKGRSGGTGMDAPKNSVAKTSQPEESMAPTVSSKPSAAVTSLRKAGLSNLIGKIAKRANKQGIMVAAVGVAPDVQGAGRAFFSTGTSTVGGGGSASKQGDSYRLGGVATHGKAGGNGNFKSGTALAGGSVGAGNVMALSDDEETVIDGGLDKDAIAEVIKRNLGQIRYCYERQLSSNPDLYGKVLVRFTIGADGGVATQKVDNSTLKSDMVEGCILRRLAGWKFPLPKGGTQVRVSYPFLFKSLD